MKCNKCGEDNQNDSVFCEYCGHKLLEPYIKPEEEIKKDIKEMGSLLKKTTRDLLQVQTKEGLGLAFIRFDVMLAPKLVKLMYSLGIIAIIIISLAIIGEFRHDWWIGLVLITAGNLVWRIICEMLIVKFKIHESLASIDSKTRKEE